MSRDYFNQSKGIISAYHNYAKLKFVCDIGSRFKSNEAMEGTGFSCRIMGHKRNTTTHEPAHPTTTGPTTTPKPVVCPTSNPSLCACGRVKSEAMSHADVISNDIRNVFDLDRHSRGRDRIKDLLPDSKRFVPALIWTPG